MAVPEDAALSRSRLARLIADGAVSGPDGPARDVKARVAEGQEYRIALAPPEPVETRAEAIPLVIAHEDDDLIVIDKPAGMVVHPAPGSPTGTLVNALLAHCGDSLSGIGAKSAPASCTASTRTRRACWSSPSRTARITALPPSSRRIPPTGAILRWRTERSTRQIRVCVARPASRSRKGWCCGSPRTCRATLTDRQRQAVFADVRAVMP